MKKESKNKVTNKVQAFGLFLNKNASLIAICMIAVAMVSSTVFATAGADALWTTLSGVIEKWVTRLGGVVMLVGGIMFGVGWQNDDPGRKTAGINTMISGGIILAVAVLTSTFFA